MDHGHPWYYSTFEFKIFHNEKLIFNLKINYNQLEARKTHHPLKATHVLTVIWAAQHNMTTFYWKPTTFQTFSWLLD